MQRISIIGAGAWGTALALTARRAGRDVVIWGREPEIVRNINESRANPSYLPGIILDHGIRATTDLAQAAAADAVLLVVPSQFLRGVCRDLAPHLAPGVPAVLCAKGIEVSTGLMMTEMAEQVLPETPLAVLSGPSFAIEVARGLPTAITLACGDKDLGQDLVAALGTPSFRPYYSDDLVGAEMGGAVKNVLAIACGIVAGRGLGDNTRAALITRGMAEIMRLAEAKGARRDTLMGLCGLGDLILTASSRQSRNFSLGVALGEGQALPQILAGRHAVTEGVASAASVAALAESLGVAMPICQAINDVLHGGADLDSTIQGLMARPFTTEQGTPS